MVVTAEATISYKPQHIDVDIDGSVRLAGQRVGSTLGSGEFNVNVIKALGIDQLLPKRVKKLSGGERQAVSIAPASVGRPTSTCSTNPRLTSMPTLAWKRPRPSAVPWKRMRNRPLLSTTTCISLTSFLDSLSSLRAKAVLRVVQQGLKWREGMNRFLAGVDVTILRDHDTRRPRINKNESRKDREQRSSGDYYSYDA